MHMEMRVVHLACNAFLPLGWFHPIQLMLDNMTDHLWYKQTGWSEISSSVYRRSEFMRLVHQECCLAVSNIPTSCAENWQKISAGTSLQTMIEKCTILS